MVKTKHIVISEETKNILNELGKKTDTYEDIIKRLIKNYNGNKI